MTYVASVITVDPILDRTVKLQPAMGAGIVIHYFMIQHITVIFPPGIAAGIVTEALGLASRKMFQWLSAQFA